MARVKSSAGRVVVLGGILLTVAAGCGSGSKSSPAPLTVAQVEGAFGGQGIQLTSFSGGAGATQLVSSTPPTVEVEILASAAKAQSVSGAEEVNGVEVKPTGTRNILVWVDSHASTGFRHRVSAAIATLQGE